MDTLKQLKRFRKALRDKPKLKPAAPAEILTPQITDHELFMQAVRGAVPITNERYPHPPRRLSPWPRQQRMEEAHITAEAMTDFWPWDELETGEELLFTRPGVSLDILRKLKRGDWVVQAELDLHGHTTDSGRLAVAAFLHACQITGKRCVRIIHGKGLSSRNHEPVLKLKLKNWLAQRDEVLAFCQARPSDGGSGAALVLLKAPRAK